MSKHHTSKKNQPTNRVGGTMSMGQEAPNQIQTQVDESIAKPTPSAESGFIPAYEEIQKRAYEIHEQKGGSDLENWLEAEQMLKVEH